MAEQLDLTTPITVPDVNNYKIKQIVFTTDVNGQTPTIKATVVGDDGKDTVVRYVPGEDGVTEALVMTGLRYINDGKFRTVASQTLQKWLLDKFVTDGKLPAGTVTGTPDV